MLPDALSSHLEADAGVRKVCPRIFPQKKAVWQQSPAIVYSIDNDGPVKLLTGHSNYREASVSIDAYAERYRDAHAIADAIESALLDFSGIMGTSTPAVDVDHIRYEIDRFDKFEADTELHAVSMQFFIGYEAN